VPRRLYAGNPPFPVNTDAAYKQLSDWPDVTKQMLAPRAQMRNYQQNPTSTSSASLVLLLCCLQ
jgi:hypothetical protein